MNIEQLNPVSFSVFSAGTEAAIVTELCTEFSSFSSISQLQGTSWKFDPRWMHHAMAAAKFSNNRRCVISNGSVGGTFHDSLTINKLPSVDLTKTQFSRWCCLSSVLVMLRNEWKSENLTSALRVLCCEVLIVNPSNTSHLEQLQCVFHKTSKACEVEF